MTLFDAFLIAVSFGVLTAILRFAVLAWMPHTVLSRFFERTLSH